MLVGFHPQGVVARVAAPGDRGRNKLAAAISEQILCRARSAGQGLPWAFVTHVLALGPIYSPCLRN